MPSMPSVGMRRTTRVFGVVKGADGARVLRSGRRLWPESSDGKLKKSGEKEEWYGFVDSKGSGKQIGWAKNVNPKPEIRDADSGDSEDHDMPDAVVAVEAADAGYGLDDKMCGIVYSRRRRKRKASGRSDLDGKKYGIQFSRRTKRMKVEGGREDCVGFRGLAAVVKSASCSEDSGFAGFLFSILSYMNKVSLKMSELSGFLLGDPIRDIYASRGVNFLRDSPSTFGSGICMFFGCRDVIPMFLVNYSAIPHCFRSIHYSIFLKHPSMPSAGVNNFTDELTDSDDEDERLGVKSSCLPSNTKPVVETPVGRLVLPLPPRNSKSDGRSSQSRSGLNSRGIRKTRSSLKSRRARSPSLASLNKYNGALASDLVSAKKNGFPFSSVVSGRKVRRSGRKRPAQDVNDISTDTTTTTIVRPELVISRDTCSTSCSANLLIIESDKCFREAGATVLLEPSASGEWHLAVKRDGITRYTHKAGEVMKPSVPNRFTHATLWTGDNGWKLEFLNRDEWLNFKDLYKECFDRNKQAVSPTSPTSPAAPAVKNIPIPGVREVPDYEDVIPSTFSRPVAYISVDNDEVSRALIKRAANYDMDCEDEQWLRRFNNEQQPSENELQEENFELMIDAFEKAFYYNPHDFSNDKPDENLCVDLGRREVVEAVYSYWVKKRKHKRSALIKALQVNQPRKAPVVPKPALRKKRSFKRQVSRHGRGKQPGLLQALTAERDALEERKALQKLDEARASASQSLEVAVSKRQRAQFLMGNADLAAYRATMALRIAGAAEMSESPSAAVAHFLD